MRGVRDEQYADDDSDKLPTLQLIPNTEKRWSGGTALGYTDYPEENEVEDDKPGLSYLCAAMFATILEDTVTALNIIGECNTHMHILMTLLNMPKLKAKKYAVEDTPEVNELDSITEKNLESTVYKLEKIKNDRKYVVDVLTATYVELTLDYKYQKLLDYVKKIHDYEYFRPLLLSEEAKNNARLRELKKQVRQQRNVQRSALYMLKSEIETRCSVKEDTEQIALIQSHFVDHFQTARIEQHSEVIKQTEGVHSNSIEYYKRLSDEEHRVHGEVDMLYAILINEALKSIEHWMTKYENDMEAIDLKIQIKKNDYQDMLIKKEHLEETLEHREKQMKNWLEFKAERERQKEYANKMQKSAIIVQAWWRGLLVRHMLGPYHPRRKAHKNKGRKKSIL